jgi:hypothetical protein
MFTITMLLGFMGYGAGFEGYENGKVYIGIYTTDSEYGWVVTNNDFYLDVILTKN